MATKNTYHVQGVLQFMIPHDVDWKVDAYSVKQAIHKTFMKLRKDKHLKNLNKTLVYNETKKLNYRIIK